MDFPNPFWSTTEALYYGSLIRIGRMGAATARGFSGDGDFDPDFWAEALRRIRAGRTTEPTMPGEAGMADIRSLFGADVRGRMVLGPGEDRTRIVADYIGMTRALLHARLDDLLFEQFSGDLDEFGGITDQGTAKADPKDAQDWFALGLAFERGVGRRIDVAEAQRCYRKAAMLGCNEGTYRQGFLLETQRAGDDVAETKEEARQRIADKEKEWEHAMFLYRTAATGGSPSALWALGQHAMFDLVPRGRSVQEPRFWFRKAKHLGWKGNWDHDLFMKNSTVPREPVSLADLALWGGIELEILSPAAHSPLHWFDWDDDADVRLALILDRNGLAAGTAYLGWCRITGRFLPKDIERGLRLARRAARDRDGRYAHFLAWALLQAGGEGAEQEALASLQRAAELGCGMAEEDLRGLENRTIREYLADRSAVQDESLHLSRYGIREPHPNVYRIFE